MLKDIIFNFTNKGTLYFNIKLLQKKGDIFKPLNLLAFSYKITLLKNTSPNNLITLFIIYYTLEIYNIIIKYINNYMRKP
jgi:hypothetical protein